MKNSKIDIRDASALVVDGATTSRTILVAQLRALGMSVAQTTRLSEARRNLEQRRFDIVICGEEFPKDDSTAQELLDELRRSGLLPFSSVFVMVTSDASYAGVAEAAESAVDAYLLKPYTAVRLLERITAAMERKAALQNIYETLENGDLERTVELCMARMEQQGDQWMQATRIGAEVLMRLERLHEAQQLFQTLWETEQRPWALLGVARVQLEANQPHEAGQTLHQLIEAVPDYADAFDVLGRTQMELGHFKSALQSYETAMNLTPWAIVRLQRLGILGYYCGEREQALEWLERSTRLGLDSKMFDSQCLALLAFDGLEKDDPAHLAQYQMVLRKRQRNATNDTRLRRIADTVDALTFLQKQQNDAALDIVRRHCLAVLQPEFDFEAALNLLGLLAVFAQRGIDVPEANQAINAIGLRFATTKAMGELLSSATQTHTPYAEHLLQSQAQIIRLIEGAMKLGLEGDPTGAVNTLREQGEQTGNAKIIESAWLVLQRYRKKIADPDALGEPVQVLRKRFETARNRPALGDKRLRPSGGVNLGYLDSRPKTYMTVGVSGFGADAVEDGV